MEALQAENTRIATESRENLERVVEAIRARSERDQEIITQLRIAVAALEAADRRATGGAAHATSAVRGEAPVPVTVDRMGRIRLPDRDADLRAGARSAIDRAGTLSSAEDPLNSLEGL